MNNSNLPQIDALPCGNWLTDKVKANLKAALILLPLLAIISSIFEEVDFLERKISLATILLSIPSEVFGAAFTCIGIYIFSCLRKGMKTFYRPFATQWAVMMCLMGLSALFDLASILEKSEEGIMTVLGFVSTFAVCGYGWYLGGELVKSYAGKLALIGSKLKIAGIVGGIASFTGLLMILDGGMSEAQALTAILGFLLVISYMVVMINLLYTSLNILSEGVKAGWTDYLEIPDELGKPGEIASPTEDYPQSNPAPANFPTAATSDDDNSYNGYYCDDEGKLVIDELYSPQAKWTSNATWIIVALMCGGFLLPAIAPKTIPWSTMLCGVGAGVALVAVLWRFMKGMELNNLVTPSALFKSLIGTYLLSILLGQVITYLQNDWKFMWNHGTAVEVLVRINGALSVGWGVLAFMLGKQLKEIYSGKMVKFGKAMMLLGGICGLGGLMNLFSSSSDSDASLSLFADLGPEIMIIAMFIFAPIIWACLWPLRVALRMMTDGYPHQAEEPQFFNPEPEVYTTPASPATTPHQPVNVPAAAPVNVPPAAPVNVPAATPVVNMMSPVQETTPAPEMPDIDSAVDFDESAPDDETAPEDGANGSRNRNILIIAIGVLALACGAWFLFFRGGSDVDDLFAKVEIPEISPAFSILQREFVMQGYGAGMYDAGQDNEGGIELRIKLIFHHGGATEHTGTPLEAYIFERVDDGQSSCEPGGFGTEPDKIASGYYKDNKLTLMDKSDSSLLLEADVENLARIEGTYYYNGVADNKMYIVLYDTETYAKLVDDTPLCVYKNDDGESIKLQYFRLPDNAPSKYKAIVVGEREFKFEEFLGPGEEWTEEDGYEVSGFMGVLTGKGLIVEHGSSIEFSKDKLTDLVETINEDGKNETLKTVYSLVSTQKIADMSQSLASVSFDERDEIEEEEPEHKFIGESVKLEVSAANGLTTPLAPQGGNTYDASNMTDGDPATAWAVRLSESRYESGQYFWGPTLNLNAKAIEHIEIRSGLCKNGTSFKNNTRPSWILIYRPETPDSGQPFADDILYEGALKDTPDVQILKVNPGYDMSRPTKALIVTFSNKQDDRYYHGEKWDDLAVSEIAIYGQKL